MTNAELFYEVGKLAEFDACSSIFFRLNEDNREQLDVYAECGDVFIWGASDVEPITEETLPVLRQAIADVEALGGMWSQGDGFLLYCARMRKMRPQNAYYRNLRVHVSVPDGLNEYGHPKRRADEDAEKIGTAKLHALFDAAGPERSMDFGKRESRPSESEVAS